MLPCAAQAVAHAHALDYIVCVMHACHEGVTRQEREGTPTLRGAEDAGGGQDLTASAFPASSQAAHKRPARELPLTYPPPRTNARTHKKMPAGLYAATAGQDCRVVVWDVQSAEAVAAATSGAPMSGLAWRPEGNELAMVRRRRRPA